MIEIIPNWHPVLAHFTVALVAKSALFAIPARIFGKAERAATFNAVALWTLWLAAGITVLTVAAGLGAYGSVAHDTPSHLAMTNHRNWALPTAALLLIVALWTFLSTRSGSALKTTQTGAILLVAALTTVTAFKAAELVYRYGLGVQSLPRPESKAGEDGHDPEHNDATSAGEVLEKSDPAATADAFHLALMTSDVEAVRSPLSANAVILESGHAQHSREEYMSGHMKSDMAFLPNITRDVTDRQTSQSANLAWVITHSRMHGD